MSEVAVEKKTSDMTTYKPPRKWKVVFLNDDTTPMEYVIEVLMTQYKHSLEGAKDVTLTIHNSGRGTAGVFPHEIAEQKAAETMVHARTHNYALQTEIEQE